MKQTSNYINNKAFFDAIVEYRKNKSLDPSIKLPDYIGQCFVSIAHRYISKPNFIGYTYKEDMIGDAIENCIKYFHNFDPEKSNNPFSYFTQIIHNSFVKRIMTEKKQSYVKHEIVKKMPFNVFSSQMEDNPDFMNQYMSFIQRNNSFDSEGYERRLLKKDKYNDEMKRIRKRKKMNPLEILMEGDDD